MKAAADGALFASYNVHKCVGVDRRFDPERIGAVIAEIGADVLAVQEADRRFGDRAGLLDLAAIERDAGLVPLPVETDHAGNGWHGNMIFVREGLLRDLRQVTLPGLEPRGALVADLDLAAGPVRVVGAHLGLLRQSRRIQIDRLLLHAAEAAERPTVLMGDFNEWRHGRRSALHGFSPGFGPLGLGAPSFPSYFPVLALDRIIARPGQILGHVAAHDSPLARKASDHLPIKARVRLAKPKG
ncbi:endonuclease/exonuclease/phosphatase family protein [Amaricoccus sp.]|uniref:endonuclease/exonuclease/phosphatase family protein n=1 Tax=Amaricoccus sp. TaxID=1872485 RepID=UPI001B4FDD00|nr:endonuclease/exonuclease/phosphatase family protein [Amaricoccus sp.]MBP7241601.1 endonuclease/exonuclease/phosphatase family protein [Amaricoccus sp.]